MQTGDALRTCSVCKEAKPRSAFSPRKCRPSGLHYNCKACAAKKQLERYRKDPKTDNDRARKWRKANKETVKNLKRKWYAIERLSPLHVLDRKLHSAMHRCLDSGTTRTKYQQAFGLSSIDLQVHLMATALDRYGYWLDSAFEVDHIQPRHTATTEDEMRRLYHYSNLQLLTPEDNRAKGRMVPGMGG